MEKNLLKLYLLLAFLCVSLTECNVQFLNKRQFRQTINEKRLTNRKQLLTCPFNDSVKNFDESSNWRNFLNILYCKFSEYKIQAAKRSYRNNNTIDYGSQDYKFKELIDEIQRTRIDENNLEIFLNRTAACNITDYDIIENITATEINTEELNLVLNLTLRDEVQVDCEGTQMFIKGNYVSTSDVIDVLLLENNINYGECKKLLSTDKTKFLNIFVLNTFFVDVNINSSIINSHKIVLLSVIAPKWENIGENKIELNGENGNMPPVGDELDGKPGKPGSPGGYFFGIGSEFINGKNLKVSVNGGNGSRGQNGKKGLNGEDGDTPWVHHANCWEKFCEENKMALGFDCMVINCHDNINLSRTKICKYQMFGKVGKKGKSGGKGGKGGKGGYPGNILLIELKNHSRISLFENIGQDGADGKGGPGGLGGRKGNDLVVECSAVFIFYNTLLRQNWNYYNYTNYERTESGPNGTDGSNSNLIENPKAAIVINNIDKAKIVNLYKRYLRENMNNRFTSSFLNEFLELLETNVNVRKVYDTLGLLDDLQHLEEQFYTISKDINFFPFYQYLLNRIVEYAHSPTEVGDIRPYKMILTYLYTSALGRAYNMKDNIESNLIIDIYAYLNSVKDDLIKLKNLENSKYKDSLINKYKDKYKHEIDIKINESKQLISEEIMPELDSFGKEIDTQIQSLVSEVLLLEKETAKEHKELIKKQRELQNTIALQGVFSVLKIFGAVVSFLGPIGAVAGAVIETGSTIAEAFMSDKTTGLNKILELPQSVSELDLINNRIKSTTNQRIIFLNNSIETISHEIKMHSDILSNLSIKISSIKDRLDTLSKNKLSLKETQALENELDAALEMQEKNLDHTDKKQLAIIKKLKGIVHLSSVLGDSFNNYKNSQEKLDILSNAVQENEDKMNKLKQYEQKIYNSITPMLQNIQKDLQDIISKLGTKSKVNLDVTKWRVQSSLRDMLLFIHQVTRGFKVEDNLARCIDKLEETMDALIKVHEHIQDYQMDKKLANYIAEISSISATDIIIANNAVLQEDLRGTVRNLEIIVRSNIVLQRYTIAMNAFKQYVFPFAHNYFKDLIVPYHLALSEGKCNVTLDNLVSKAAIEIEKINSKLEDYKNTVTNRDGCIGVGEFQSGYVSTKPFFVWKNEQHNSMISKLLSGNVVMVKADVINSALDKDAIKFNIIDFNFRSKNETLQTEINNKLKGFQITVNHLGNSDYRYENKIYEMMTGTQEIWYYLEKKANGEPVLYSLSYKKIMHGNVTLSPYATWKIKLDNVTDEITFKDLEMYKDSIDLTLEGYGYFLNKRSQNCIDLMVDNYYKAINSCHYVDSNTESYAVSHLYPYKDNPYKTYKIFKGFF